MKLLGAIDQGTSSTRFIVFSPGGDIISSYQTEFPQIHQHPGWTEHDPKILVETVRRCIEMVEEDLLSKDLTVKDIIAVGITNQRETTVVWDRVTGEPLYNAIVWLDGRTHSTAEMLTEKTPTKSRDYWVPRAGTQLTTYFSGVKLRWMLDNVDAVKKAQEEDRLMFGTVDSWLIYNLTGGRKGGVHVTDVSNASRTLLMNLETLQWDDELVEFFGTKKSVLPEIRSSAEIYGTITEGPLFGIPISGCLGDQQAALVGHTCFNAGDIKNTYGTGCFMLFNTGTKPVISKHSLITTVGYKLGKDAPAYYALEGSIAIAGAAVKWLRDNLGIIQDSSEISELASKVKDSGGVHFVPAFNGLFAPYWRGDARGCIVGISQYTRKEHLARATLEAICFQSYEIIDAMRSDSGKELTVLKVDGGLTNSDLCMQIQSDTIGINVERPHMREMTALGAAIAAGIGCGFWKSEKDVVNQMRESKKIDIFTPVTTPDVRENHLDAWKKAIKKSFP